MTGKFRRKPPPAVAKAHRHSARKLATCPSCFATSRPALRVMHGTDADEGTRQVPCSKNSGGAETQEAFVGVHTGSAHRWWQTWAPPLTTGSDIRPPRIVDRSPTQPSRCPRSRHARYPDQRMPASFFHSLAARPSSSSGTNANISAVNAAETRMSGGNALLKTCS